MLWYSCLGGTNSPSPPSFLSPHQNDYIIKTAETRAFQGGQSRSHSMTKKQAGWGDVVREGALLPVVAVYWHVLNTDTTISNKSQPRRSARWNALEEIKTSFSIQFSIERNTKEAKLTYHLHSQDAKGKKGSNICSWKICSWIIFYKKRA